MKSDEQADDDPRAPPRAPFVPSEAWIEAFDAQCTERMIRALRRYAASWARFVGGDTGSDYAEELVQTALTDILGGVLRWDPDAGELEPYLVMVIRLRARRDRKSAARYEHVFIDAFDADEPTFGDLESSLAAGASDPTMGSAEEVEEVMHQKMEELRELASGDLDAQLFLDAVDQDAITKAQVMRFAALSDSQYRNARRRLARLVVQLTPGRSSSTKED